MEPDTNKDEADSSSEDDLFPGAEYHEDAPLKPEIAEIGNKPLSQVLLELKKEASQEGKRVRVLPPQRVTIEDKVMQGQQERAKSDAERKQVWTDFYREKRVRSTTDHIQSQEFKKPK